MSYQGALLAHSAFFELGPHLPTRGVSRDAIFSVRDWSTDQPANRHAIKNERNDSEKPTQLALYALKDISHVWKKNLENVLHIYRNKKCNYRFQSSIGYIPHSRWVLKTKYNFSKRETLNIVILIFIWILTIFLQYRPFWIWYCGHQVLFAIIPTMVGITALTHQQDQYYT